MNRTSDIILIVAIVALVIVAALSGVWMKKPERKDKDEIGGVSVYVIIPPSPAPAPPAPPQTDDGEAPTAKLYPL